MPTGRRGREKKGKSEARKIEVDLLELVFNIRTRWTTKLRTERKGGRQKKRTWE
jgi:hypothetical protein